MEDSNKKYLDKIRKIIEKRYNFSKEDYIYTNMNYYIKYLEKFCSKNDNYSIKERCIRYLNILKKEEMKKIRNIKRAIRRIQF